MKINLTMIVKNEERSIRRCLLAAADFVDEIVIVDTGSTDRTVEIIEETGKELNRPTYIGHFTWIDDFAAARNYALALSEQYGAEYHLMLDADEYLLSDKYPETVPKTQNTHADRQVLERFITRMNEKYHGEWIGCVGIFNLQKDKDSIGQSLEYAQRFFKAGIRYTGAIHEQPDTKWQLVASPIYSEHDGYLYSNKSERNLPYLDKAAAADPKDPYLHYQLAQALAAVGKQERAVEEYGRFYTLLKEHPVKPTPEYFLTGTLRYLQLLYRIDSVESLERAKTISDEAEASGAYEKDPDFWFFLGMFYMKYVLKDTKKNIGYLARIPESYQRCLAIGEGQRLRGTIGTGSYLALYNLGLWYELNGQTKEAISLYQKASTYQYAPAEDRLLMLTRPANHQA
jgi:glycosyltransferase involved in cell wall biosynthesis